MSSSSGAIRSSVVSGKKTRRGEALNARRLGAIGLLVFDFDGVLTDNRVIVGQDGQEAVVCHRGDGLGFDMLRRAGIRALILSTERNPVVAARAAKLQVEVLQAVEDKGTELRRLCQKQGVPLARVWYVGNDVNDLPAIRLAGVALCPADAHPLVHSRCDIVLRTNGGGGVVREIVEEILRLEPTASFPSRPSHVKINPKISSAHLYHR